jgi:hypothetical protein
MMLDGLIVRTTLGMEAAREADNKRKNNRKNSKEGKGYEEAYA